ncbi:MAG: hypothetical protein M3Z09_03465 [Acidobacteriota bacterium]|nr:hypothetical protein [Acidobacteriota bacterium]
MSRLIPTYRPSDFCIRGYVVEPTGSKWVDLYGQTPDVGLNQPARWQVDTSNVNRGDGSCLVFDNGSSNVDCATQADKVPADPWSDQYHWMRGFFITGASANGNGPQLGSATSGDQLLLQARIHNFSLKAMAPGTSVHVRFYGMHWNTTTNTQVGPSFFIGEQTSPQAVIPPFNNDTDLPNWVLVDTLSIQRRS